jgi:hypothetical protein
MHQTSPRIDPASNLASRLSLGLKFAALTVCVMACFSGRYPPAHAQGRRVALQTVPVLTVKDAEQDDNIAQLAHHLESVDGTIGKQGDAINSVTADIAEFKGEERIIGFVLTLLISGSIVLQFRTKTP